MNLQKLQEDKSDEENKMKLIIDSLKEEMIQQNMKFQETTSNYMF